MGEETYSATYAQIVHKPCQGYTSAYVMALSDEQIAKQLGFAAMIEAQCAQHGKPPLEIGNPSLALMRYQLQAERWRRDGVAP